MVKILVIGELCIDRFIYGVINRLCPEAPVPVLNPVEIRENNGMAGNVVDNLKALSDNIDVVHWHQSNKIEKTRFVEKKSNQMVVRVDDGEMNGCESLTYLSPEQRKTINESDIVIISDYNKGYLSNTMIQEIAAMSKLIIMDSKKQLSYDIIKDINFVKVNENEYKNNKEIADEYGEKFIITLGANGVKHNGIHYPSNNPQETIDVSGAGDTFVASFILKYFKTNSMEQSLNFANDACANVVNKKGVAVPDDSFKL